MRHQVYCCFCLVTKSSPTLCYPMYCSSSGSSVHGISQARILEGVAISFSRGSSWPRDRTCIFSLPGRYFTLEPPRKPTWSLLEKLFFSFSLSLSLFIYLFIFIFYFFLFVVNFVITLKWNSHRFACVPHPDPPSHLPFHPLPLGFPSAPGPSACLMHPTWAGDLFHPR